MHYAKNPINVYGFIAHTCRLILYVAFGLQCSSKKIPYALTYHRSMTDPILA